MKKISQILKSKKFLVFSIIIISLSLSYYLFGENFHAKWWYIDDHEIMMFLGEDGKITLNEIPKVLIEKTEVGDYGSYERYRPSYYFLRLIETSILGDNPMLWYFSRIVILTSFLSILWYLVSKGVGYIKGFFFVLLVLSANYWAEIISRLGPSETYAVFGLGLFLLGLYQQFKIYNEDKEKDKKNFIVSLILMTIGAIIAIGSKENFIILIIPTILLSLYAIIKKKMNIGLLISSLVIILYGVFVMSSIIIALSKTNIDVYGSTINTKDLVIMTLKHIPDVLKLFWMQWVVILTVISSFIVYRIRGVLKFKEYMKRLLFFYASVFSLIGLYLSQIFFYKGLWPTGMRYDFPGLLYYPFYLLTLFFLIKWTFEILNIKKYYREQIYTVIIILTFVFISPLQYFDYFQAYSKENVVRTNSYTEIINSIEEKAKQDPSQPIFFESYSVWDHELMVSVNRFLRARRVENDIYININNYSIDTVQSSLEKNLVREINVVASKGGDLAGEKFVSRSGDISKTPGCITVNFSGITDDVCTSFIIR